MQHLSLLALTVIYFYFSAVIEMLAGQFAATVDAPLVTLLFEAYSACKMFLLEAIPSLQEVSWKSGERTEHRG